MVERYRRSRGKKKLLGNHQKCWIWGRHAVTETIRAGAWIPLELHLAESLENAERGELRSVAESHGTRVFEQPGPELRRLCRSGEHQGFVAKMPEFPYADADTLLASRPPCPLYVILDGVQDPYNLGAIIRSAEVLGVNALFLKASGQVGVTSLVARTSAGAVNYLPIAQFVDLPALLVKLHEAGVAVYATDRTTGQTACECDFRPASAFLIGNESTGLPSKIQRHCKATVTIPQRGHLDSLNAAVAASVLFYEAARQRAEC